MGMWYYLNENKQVCGPVEHGDPKYLEALKQFEDKKVVGKTTIGGALVSTVFLGLDHGYPLETKPAKPVVFETMIFGDDYCDENEYQERCCTWSEAQSQHEKAVRMLVAKEGS